jgi:hypothetical protein
VSELLRPYLQRAVETKGSISTTLQSYAKPAAVAGAKQRRLLTVLDGGVSAFSTVQP